MYWSFRLRGDARGRNGSVRKELAEGVGGGNDLNDVRSWG